MRKTLGVAMNCFVKAIAASAMVLLTCGFATGVPAGNKSSAVSAMTEMFNQRDPSAVDRYFTSPYRQHNLYIPDGIDALKGLATEVTKWEGVHTAIHRALAQGDLVLLHSSYWNLLSLHKAQVAFDLFRFKDGKIVEHWDALQPVQAANAAEAADPAEISGATEIDDLNKTSSNRAMVSRYVKEVLIAGKSNELQAFVAPRRFLDHRPQTRYVFDSSKPDLSTPVELLSKVRYLKIHRTLADGNFVFVQSEGRAQGFPSLKIYDLFRVEGGKLVEHWDVLQPVAARAQWLNPNGPF